MNLTGITRSYNLSFAHIYPRETWNHVDEYLILHTVLSVGSLGCRWVNNGLPTPSLSTPLPTAIRGVKVTDSEKTVD